MEMEFEQYKSRLFNTLLSDDYLGGFSELIDELHNQGASKENIYKLFLEFHKEIQIDSRTRDSEKLYDDLSDFMDGFTSWAKGFRVLPDEPDL